MLDLFTVSLSIEEKILKLKEDIKTTYIKSNTITKRKKINLFCGNLDNINNNVLVVSSPPEAKFFKSEVDNLTVNLLNEFGMYNYILTYNFLIQGLIITKKEIKEFGYWIRQIVDIVNPKLIICMGEDSQLSFFKRKSIMREHHGEQIGEYNSIPIVTTYPVVYYMKRTDYEDSSYKDYIKTKDWDKIKTIYNKVIKC